MSMLNGQSEGLEPVHPDTGPASPHSESDLSDPDPEIINNITLASGDGYSMAVDEEMEMSDSDADDDAEGEEDADFYADSPPPEEDLVRPASHSSHSSIRPGKRKASIDEDEFMSLNPELYGLRRSVSVARQASKSR